MIEKIVSGGQTGADQGALDAALELDIAHGGWIPLGRRTEAGPLPDKYRLKEMATASYPKRTEQNVIDSDGTLILSRGHLAGGSDFTRKMAMKHIKPWLYVDLSRIAAFEGAVKINNWIIQHDLRILNVAGPRASHDQEIYYRVKKIIASVYYLNVTQSGLAGIGPQGGTVFTPAQPLPRTVEEVVDLVIGDLSARDRTRVAHLQAEELPALEATLGEHLIKSFEWWSTNPELWESCQVQTGNDRLTTQEAAEFLILKIWETLRKSHRLRRIK